MSNIIEVNVPDIGDFDEVEVIEILVAVGDTVEVEDSLVTLESDKASMEIPSPVAGTVVDVKIEMGLMAKEGTLILLLDAKAEEKLPEVVEPPKVEEKKETPLSTRPKVNTQPPVIPKSVVNESGFKKAYASPGVRKFARELGADLSGVSGSANKGRITKEDVKAFIKQTMQGQASGASNNLGNALGVAPMPDIDFSKFGNVETAKLSKINKITGQVLHRNWVTIPHVTQFDDVDITDMEAFRKSMAAERHNPIKVTPLVFIMKAVVSALKAFPRFNSSLASSGEELILKNYFHIGVAMDTPDGLVVPVIRDVDQKGIVELGEELRETSVKAREKKLKPADMQGGCFTISSLGGIGGTSFTPIVNAPEVAILGVSRSSMKPVYQDGEFVPRLMLPLSLSYDHRVIDGADGARFITYLNQVLSDIRKLLM